MRNKMTFLGLLLLFSFRSILAQEEAYPFTYGIGDFNITVLPEVQQSVDVSILIGATDEMLKQSNPDVVLKNAINAFLIETSDKTILVDAGLGRMLFSHLETCGKSAEDIDVILLTHMHMDHIGGLLKEGEKAFPSATLYISQPEYDFWMNDEFMLKQPVNQRGAFEYVRNILTAYKDRIHLFIPGNIGNAGTELLPGIRGIAAYGHTPGHTAYLLESDEYQFLVWGDLTHVLPVQISYPEVAVTYDTDPAKAIESRQQLLKYVSENGVKVAGMHIEYPGMADVKGSISKGYGFTLLCTCEGIIR